jgi:5'-nucleotidase
VTVTGAGFTPGTTVTATLPSRGGQVVGRGVVAADGTVSVRFTAPVLLPKGSYPVVLTAADGETATTSFSLRSVLQEIVDRIKELFR